MATVLLVIHVTIALGLIISILLQRSEGGALGIGGGAGGMSGRSSANLMTRTTAVLGAGFFLTSIALTVLARTSVTSESKIDAISLDGPVDATIDTSKLPGGVKIVTPPKTAPKKIEGPVIPTPEK